MKEWQLHAYVADLLRFRAKLGVLWFHVPNEGLRAKRTGAFLKRLGMRPGVADFIVIVHGNAHFLELKTPTGRVSLTQRTFQKDAIAANCSYAFARSPHEADRMLAAWGAVDSASAVRRAA